MTFVSTADLLAILPELLVMAGGCLVLVLDPLTARDRKDWLAYFSLAVLGAAFVVGYWFLGAVPAVRIQSSITSRGTGRLEKSRTVRRRFMSV